MKKDTKQKLVFKVKPALDIAEGLKAKVISDKVINFTKERAFAYLELDTFQGERPVNENHVQFLYNEWSGGRFMWGHVILCQGDLNGKRYRLNGQHTAWMRVNCDENVFVKKGEEPRVREVVYAVENEDQLRTLYSTFDRNKTRTPGHVFKALLAGTSYAQDVWTSMLPTMLGGMRLWQVEEKDKLMVTANDMAALVSDRYEQLFRIVGIYWQQHYGDARWIKRSAVIAALFATFEAAGGKAPEFWDPVFNGLNLSDKSDPRYALRKFFETHKQSLKSSTALFASAEDSYRIAILAWNKWRSGQKTIASLRATDKRQKAR